MEKKKGVKTNRRRRFGRRHPVFLLPIPGEVIKRAIAPRRPGPSPTPTVAGRRSARAAGNGLRRYCFSTPAWPWARHCHRQHRRNENPGPAPYPRDPESPVAVNGECRDCPDVSPAFMGTLTKGLKRFGGSSRPEKIPGGNPMAWRQDETSAFHFLRDT